MTAAVASARAPLAELHARLEAALPAVRRSARAASHRLRCRHARADAIAEALLAAWGRFLRLVTEGLPVDPHDLARRAVDAAALRLRRFGPLPA